MYRALYLSPMIPSFNVKETAHFFKNVFRFTVVRDDEHYTILSKDNLTIQICRAGKDIGEMSFYLEVDEIDKFWKMIKNKLKALKVRQPFDREYGMREFHLIIPQTKTLLFVGQKMN
jgi:hypothetical protein